ncbi:MAG: NifB/NifX family molybdenum-iron cluster-binding protein [Firmicutes bacterium]|nr:NifB/NifX family molybdenum-iron cluster-binding protein [Bacillota bacterium]
MRIAIAKEGNHVSQHFGHCEGFELVDIDKGKVAGRETVPNPGHKPGFLPVFLAEKGVKVIIAGGMGGSAQQLFSQNGIKVYTGVWGDVYSVIDDYLAGTLKSEGGVCQSHHFEGNCGE